MPQRFMMIGKPAITMENPMLRFLSIIIIRLTLVLPITNCVQQIIEGCWDIANEVGDAKIGDPYDLYVAGKSQDALYAVESWFSWHSREDYSNNIISIYSAICGTRDVRVNNDVMDLTNSVIAAKLYL